MPSLIKLQPLAENERRRSPRYLVPPTEPLVVGVAVMGSEGRPRSLTGRVRDISGTGLSILLPKGEGCRELTERGLPLVIVLTLPSGVIRLRAEVAHCAARRGRRGGYLAGVRVTEIAAGGYDRLAEYIEGRTYSRRGAPRGSVAKIAFQVASLPHALLILFIGSPKCHPRLPKVLVPGAAPCHWPRQKLC